MDQTEARVNELVRCANDPAHFINAHCRIYDNVDVGWVPFKLWPAQVKALDAIHSSRRVVILKARQLGMTWLCLAYILWSMLFKPPARPMVLNRREEDAITALGPERLRGMYRHLPGWMKEMMNAATESDAGRMWSLANESVVHAFPPIAGDGYTGTFALADEYDVLDDKQQKDLMRSVEPTVNAGGKLVLLSRSDKGKPDSTFKNIYRAAKAGTNGWTHLFLSWKDRLDRDDRWYAEQVKQAQGYPSPQDFLDEQYPDSDTAALAPLSLAARIPYRWLHECYREMKPLPVEALPPGTPAIPGLEVYVLPVAGRRYRVGVDTSEGNPQSDPAALTVTDERTGEECCAMEGRFEPAVLAGHVDQVGRWYNDAGVMVERNNHGHTVILWLDDNSKLPLLCGPDGKVGWLSNSKGKDALYDNCAEHFRDGATILHSFATLTQLGSIEGKSLRAPEGQHDDRADSFALSLAVAETEWYTQGCLSN